MAACVAAKTSPSSAASSPRRRGPSIPERKRFNLECCGVLDARLRGHDGSCSTPAATTHSPSGHCGSSGRPRSSVPSASSAGRACPAARRWRSRNAGESRRSRPALPCRRRAAAKIEIAFGDDLSDFNGTSIAVATDFKVTPAQATSASSSMSPEHNSSPEPPVAGCRPATASARPVSTLQAIPSLSSEPLAFRVMQAALGSDL